MPRFEKVDWPHYGVLDSSDNCAWCDHPAAWHKFLLPWESPFLERPIAETTTIYGGSSWVATAWSGYTTL